MPLEISLHPLNKSHAPEIQALIAGLSGPGLPRWSVDQITAEFGDGQGIGAFGEQKDLLGFVLFHSRVDHIDISFLASRPEFQKLGIMTQIFKELRSRYPAVPLWLEVHEKNVNARKFYEKFAFKVVGRRPDYYRDNGAAILYST